MVIFSEDQDYSDKGDIKSLENEQQTWYSSANCKRTGSKDL